MIITRTPYRISFFGGGTDFPYWYKKYGSTIISSSIDAFCYVTIRKLLPFYGNDYRISWSKIEEVNDIKNISSSPTYPCTHITVEKLMKDGIPVIFHAVLHNYNNNCYFA